MRVTFTFSCDLALAGALERIAGKWHISPGRVVEQLILAQIGTPEDVETSDILGLPLTGTPEERLQQAYEFFALVPWPEGMNEEDSHE